MRRPAVEEGRSEAGAKLIRLPEAARQLGVSYQTMKQWIYRGKINSIQTAGGHHRIPRSEIDRVLFQRGRPAGPGIAAGTQREQPGGAGMQHRISGRNQLVGRVTSVKIAGLLAKVTLDISGQKVTAIITRDSCKDLNLREGDTAAALIKATEVMIIRPA